MRKPISLLLLLTTIGCHTTSFAQTQNTAGFQGKVYAAEFGALLSNIRIQVMRGSKVIQTALSNEDGNYQVSGLVAGGYTIVIEEKGFVHRQLQVDLKPDRSLAIDIDVQVVDIGTYSVEPKDEVKGEVKQTNGGPVEDATVTVVDPFTAEIGCSGENRCKGRVPSGCEARAIRDLCLSARIPGQIGDRPLASDNARGKEKN